MMIAIIENTMDPLFDIMKKRRPSMENSGVKPVSREVHGYLISSYLILIFTFCIGGYSALRIFCVCVAFVVMGFLFYGLLLAMVKMSHDEKKRLMIGQTIFIFCVLALALRILVLSG